MTTDVRGWALTDEARERLVRALAESNVGGFEVRVASTFTLEHAIALITDAATNELGIAVLERHRYSAGKDVAIAFRGTEQIYFGVRLANDPKLRPSHLWPALKPWFDELGRNRARLQRWAAGPEVLGFPRVGFVDPTTDRDGLGAELLAAVIAEPHDVSRRLIYADWLTRCGDAQGELIQLCERNVERPDRALHPEIRRLEQFEGPRLAGELVQLARSYAIERGFVARISMSATKFAKHGQRLLAQHPIRELALDPVDPESLARLARAPALRGLRGLLIEQPSGAVRPLPLDAICASPHFDALEQLAIRNWVVSGDPAEAFARLRAPALEALHLYHVDPTPEIVAGLARNPDLALTDLRVTLRLRGHDQPARTWPTTLAGGVFTRLKRLWIQAFDKPELLAGARLPELVDLFLAGKFGQPPIQLDEAELPNLRRLHLMTCLIDDRALARLLARQTKLQALCITSLPESMTRERAMEVALAIPDEHPLAAVEFDTNFVDPELVARFRRRFPDAYEPTRARS